MAWGAIWTGVWTYSHLQREAYYERVEAALVPVTKLEAEGKTDKANEIVNELEGISKASAYRMLEAA